MVKFFDAYVFVADLVKRAKKNIHLIDNYVDETVFKLLSKSQERYRHRLHQKYQQAVSARS